MESSVGGSKVALLGCHLSMCLACSKCSISDGVETVTEKQQGQSAEETYSKS